MAVRNWMWLVVAAAWAGPGCAVDDSELSQGSCEGDTSDGPDEAAFDWDTWSEGMSRDGEAGVHRYTLLAADPAPPDKGDNSWTVAVQDAEGAAVAGGVVLVEPVMPLHGHGTAPATFTAQESADPGTYVVGPFDLFMAGTWEIAVSSTAVDDTTDRAVFTFCVQG